MSNFVQQTIKKGKKYTDYDFVAGKNSLLDPNSDNGGLDANTVSFFEKI